MVEENRFAFRETPTYGQFMALQMYVGLLSGILYKQDPDTMEELAQYVENITEMNKSSWRMTPEQVEEFDIAWNSMKLGLEGRFPIF